VIRVVGFEGSRLGVGVCSGRGRAGGCCAGSFGGRGGSSPGAGSRCDVGVVCRAYAGGRSWGGAVGVWG